MRKFLAKIAELRNKFVKFLESLPFWPEVVKVATIITSPVVRLSEAVLRVAPFLKKLDWLLEIQLLQRRHPVILALSMGYMLWRGLHTTPLGHIGTDQAVYPFLAAVSGYNPFLGIICGFTFGVGDLLQKLIVPDMFGTHGWGDANYWAALVGYLLAYSSLVWMGWFPGAVSRTARYGARIVLRNVFDRRAAAAADGAGPSKVSVFAKYFNSKTGVLNINFKDPQVLDVVKQLNADPRNLFADPDAWRSADLTPEQKVVMAGMRSSGYLGPDGEAKRQAIIDAATTPSGTEQVADTIEPQTPVEEAYPPPGMTDGEIVIENIVALLAGTFAAYESIGHVAPIAEKPAFDFRPNPDASCERLEFTTILPEQAATVGVAGMMGAAAPVIAGQGMDPGGAGATGKPGKPGLSAPPSPFATSGQDDTHDAIQSLQNSYQANQHDYNQAQQNLQEAQNRFNSLPPDQQAALAANPDYQAEIQHYNNEMANAQRSMDGYRNELANLGATPDAGVDPYQEYTRGSASAHVSRDLDNAKWNQEADRYEKAANQAAGRSGHEGALFDNPNYQVFDPDTGTFDPNAWARLQNAVRGMQRAEHQVQEGYAQNVDASLEQAIGMGRMMRDTGQAAAMMIFPANSLAGMGMSFGYGAMSGASDGKGVGESILAGAETASTNLIFHYGFELGGKVLGAAGRWAGILPKEPVVPNIGKIDPEGPRVYTDSPGGPGPGGLEPHTPQRIPTGEVVTPEGPRPYVDAPESMPGPPERAPEANGLSDDVKITGEPNQLFKRLKDAEEVLGKATLKRSQARASGDPDAIAKAASEVEAAWNKRVEAQAVYNQADPRRAYRGAMDAMDAADKGMQSASTEVQNALDEYRKAKATLDPSDPATQAKLDELRDNAKNAVTKAGDAQRDLAQASQNARDAATRLRQHITGETPEAAFKDARAAVQDTAKQIKPTTDANEHAYQEYKNAKATLDPNDPETASKLSELKQKAVDARIAAKVAEQNAAQASQNLEEATTRLRNKAAGFGDGVGAGEGQLTSMADKAIRDRFGITGNPNRGGMRIVADSNELRYQQTEIAKVNNDWKQLKPGDEGYVDPSKIKLKEDGVLGFNSRETGQSVAMRDPGVVIHERLHANTSEQFKTDFGGNKTLNEGLTNHFAMVAGENVAGYNRLIKNSYKPEVDAIKSLESKIGRDPLHDAYFNGKTDDLARKVGYSLGAKSPEMALEQGKAGLKKINTDVQRLGDLKKINTPQAISDAADTEAELSRFFGKMQKI